jgi:transmembrane sensor
MSAFEALSAEDQARLSAAAVWSERLRGEPELEISPQFQQWIQDGANARAFEAVQGAMEALQEIASNPGVLDMRGAAFQRLRDAGPRRWFSRRRIGLAIAAGLLVLLGAGGYLYQQFYAAQIYVTESGERRVVPLPDGSRITLDSDTEVRVRYTQEAREITLENGRARFDVAHDVARPFTVAAGNETVVAVGTSFNVERLGQKVLVTLIQGRVLIKKESQKSLLSVEPRRVSNITLAAGEQVAADENTAPVVKPANLDAATAWEAGHLVFRGEPLGDAVARVNRYTVNPIAVEPSAAAIPISGVFNAGDIGSFVSAITGYFPVEATTDSDNRIHLQKRS